MFACYSCWQVVMLTFHSFSTQACCDFLNMYDGGNIDSPLIDTLNGSLAVPIVIAGTRQEMYIQFTSDANVISTGFSADIVTTSCKKLLPRTYCCAVAFSIVSRTAWVPNNNVDNLTPYRFDTY